MPRLLAAFIALCMALLGALPVYANNVKVLRVGKHENNTRVVFEFTDKQGLLPKKVFTLQSPDRVVVDFPNTKFMQKLESIELPPGVIVQGLRQGQFDNSTVRLVIDLAQPAKTSTFSLKANKQQGARLVLDLIPTKARVKISAAVKKPPEPVAKATPKASASPAKPAEKPAQAKPKANEPITITQKGGPIVIDQPTATPSIVASGKKRRDKVVVIIDPGHGGVDPGAIGKSKSYEKDVVLSLGLQVRDIINDTPGYVAYMTRDRDIFIPLAQRVRTAQRRKADLFVSIHADSHANRDVRGGSVYVLSETASDKEAERLARVANEGDMVAGIDLSEEEDQQVRNILIDLVQRETMNKSAIFAREMISEMNNMVKMKSTEPRFAGFRVLKAPEVPSILVEASYMSNPDDEAMLNSEKAQKRLAASIARGIFNYSRKYLNAE